jgi:hypothetical protein
MALIPEHGGSMFLQNVGMSPYDVTTQKINIEMTSTELVS